jgi:hypothetical protein
MSTNKIIAIGVSVVVLAVVVIGAWSVMTLNKNMPPAPPEMTVPKYPSAPGVTSIVAADFGTKIVYESLPPALTNNDDALLQEDCSARGGVYSDCGTSCAPGAELCAAVCAAVCDAIPVQVCDAKTPCPKDQSCYVLPGSTSPQCVLGDPCVKACGQPGCMVLESYPMQVKCQP